MNEGKKVPETIKNGALVGSETQRPKKELVILRGVTTSQINQALKAKKPYPARVFLKAEGQSEDIPVFFRIKCPFYDNTPCHCEWEKPKIPTGSLIEVKGYFDNPINGPSRKSFTAHSHKILNQGAKIETHVK